jgi:hypothetical protein
MRRFLLALAMAFAAVLVVPQIASAHVERPSYWPDPAPDCSVNPCAGGAIPRAKSLASALDASAVGRTRVVCHADSMTRLKAAIRHGLAHGYYVRPSDHESLSAKRAAKLLSINRALFKMCTYHQIQPAVTASGNNDRVVVMPGLYTELRQWRPGRALAPVPNPLPKRCQPDLDRGPRCRQGCEG